jgi:ribonuclease P protein component
LTPSFKGGVLFFMAASFGFGRKEKLKSRKQLDELFAKGKSFSVFPVKVFYSLNQEATDFPVKLAVGATKRSFKKAVDRNRIKRLLREAYRLNKQPLIDWSVSKEKNITVFLLFIAKTLPSFEELQIVMPVILEKLIKRVSENTVSNT